MFFTLIVPVIWESLVTIAILQWTVDEWVYLSEESIPHHSLELPVLYSTISCNKIRKCEGSPSSSSPSLSAASSISSISSSVSFSGRAEKIILSSDLGIEPSLSLSHVILNTIHYLLDTLLSSRAELMVVTVRFSLLVLKYWVFKIAFLVEHPVLIFWYISTIR